MSASGGRRHRKLQETFGRDEDEQKNWPNSPISQALRMIGVVAEQGMDEFDTVGLGKHRKTHQWANSIK